MPETPETIKLSKLREIIRRESSRWTPLTRGGLHRDFLDGCEIGAMGACANILCAAEGFNVCESPDGKEVTTEQGDGS